MMTFIELSEVKKCFHCGNLPDIAVNAWAVFCTYCEIEINNYETFKEAMDAWTDLLSCHWGLNINAQIAVRDCGPSAAPALDGRSGFSPKTERDIIRHTVIL